MERESGKGAFPASRILRTMKADEEVRKMAISKETVFLINIATEQFLVQLCKRIHRMAGSESRATLQVRDLYHVVKRSEEYQWMLDIYPEFHGQQLVDLLKPPRRERKTNKDDEDEDEEIGEKKPTRKNPWDRGAKTHEDEEVQIEGTGEHSEEAEEETEEPMETETAPQTDVELDVDVPETVRGESESGDESDH
ncbi:hypothetical protein BKA62DRAFT_696785 [Auriculariales sp. MPI-PUGE-AT-0066]|nr:hypothetical protein BKA62DRAFT_696785 [Auriculariales sp. MPI-PUGE-AT-0066]